jgi:hypothetical protein
MGKGLLFKRQLLIGVLLVWVVTLVGCTQSDKTLSEQLVLTVDESKVYMDEMVYHVMLAEIQGQLYGSLSEGEASVFVQETERGNILKEALKEQAMENAIRYEIFYQEALHNNIKLTAEEETACREKTESFLKSIQEEALTSAGIERDSLLKLQYKLALSTKYYNEFKNQKEAKIQEEDIRTKLSKENYKQYDIQYLYGGTGQKEQLETLREKAVITEDITKLSKGTELNTGTLSFLAGRNTFGEEANLEEYITQMEVSEVSTLIETVKGFYLIKLTDNTSNSEYEKAVLVALKAEQQAEAENAYETLRSSYRININQELWKKVTLDSQVLKTGE